MEGTPEKWRKCLFCERSFAKVEHLKRHQRSHTGEKPFKCPKCDKQYARSDVLARHIQNHPTRTYKAKTSTHAQNPRIGDTILDRPAAQDTAAIPGSSTPTIGPEQLHTDTSENLGLYSNGPTVAWMNGNETTIHTAVVNQDSPHARIVTSPTTDSNQVRDNDDQMPRSAQEQQRMHNGNAPIDMSHISGTALNTQPPAHRSTPPLHQSVANIFQQCSTELLEGRNAILPGNDQYNHDSSLLYHPPLSQSVFDSWPLTNPIYNEFPFSDDHFDYGIDAEGASLEIAVGQLDQPSNPLDLEILQPDVPMTDDAIEETEGFGSALGPQSLTRIEHLWSSKETPYPDRLVRTLWNDIAEHNAANICSDPAEQPVSLQNPSLNCAIRGSDRRKMSKECRARLISFYDRTQNAPGKSPALVAASSSLSPSSQQSDKSSSITAGPNISHLQLPSEETLDLSIEFYFRHVHPSLPFIHKPTFNVTETPSLLLLPMILIGYSILDPCGSKTLVSQCRTHLTELCRLDLVAKARGKCSPSGLIRSMASSLLVLYLNLDEQNRDEGTAFMLCAQTLHIVERHGLYETHHSKDLIASLLAKHSSGEDGWKLWARIESVKRLILCLVRIDTAYARLFGTAGVIDPNQVSIVLHANSILFESPTATRFFDDATNKSAVYMPIIHMRDMATCTPPVAIMSNFLLLTILGNIYLSIATAQLHILPVAEQDLLKRCSFAPINVYNELADTKCISRPLVAISEKFAGLLRPPTDQTATLLWNYLCMIITAPVEQLELALGRKGPNPAPKALESIRIWSNSAAARRAALHAAQIFYTLSSGLYMPLQAAEKKLLRVESLIFTSALVLGLYLSLSGASSFPPSTIMVDSHSGGTLELLQEIDWSIIKDEGLANQDSDLPIALNNIEGTHPIEPTKMQARQFIRHGGLSISFNGELQLQDGNTARKYFLEYAYLLDQSGGSSESGSEYANLLRSISHLAS